MNLRIRPALTPVALALGVVLLLTCLVYSPGLDGPFLLDDRVNLQQLGEDGGVDDFSDAVKFVLGNRSGPAGRPIAMVSFLLDGETWPTAARPFKVTNLIIHLANGLLIAWFSWLVLGTLKVAEQSARLIAVLAAAFWLLHPLNVSTTLYVVQRMTQLMTLFSLSALVCYLIGRESLGEKGIRGILLMSLGLFPFGLLAVLSKENGALLLIAILAAEATLFSGARRPRLHRAWLACGVILPLVIVAVYVLARFNSLTLAYQFREFSLAERLLSEGRILVIYLVNILLPRIQDFGLHHDDLVISQSLLVPLTTLISLLAIVGLLALAWLWRRRQPMFSFAVFWFFGWQLLESTFLPLELYFEHRNYVAMIVPLLALAYYLHQAVRHLAGDRPLRISAVIGTSVTAVLAVLTLQLALLWGNNLALAAHWAARHPGSYRAQVEYAYLLAELDESASGYQLIATLQQRFPDEVALQLLRWNFACSNGMPAPYPVGEVATGQDLVYYRADLTGEVKTLLDNLFSQRCNYPPRGEVEELMNRLARVPMRQFERSGFHLLFSDFYVHYRELNPALMQLRTAFEIRPDAGFPIRQAILSASAGNYQDSLVFLQRARQADEERARFVPSRLQEIHDMEQDLKELLGEQ